MKDSANTKSVETLPSCYRIIGFIRYEKHASIEQSLLKYAALISSNGAVLVVLLVLVLILRDLSVYSGDLGESDP